MRARRGMLCLVFAATALAGEAPFKDPTSETELVETLRALDRDYKAKLAALLRSAVVLSAPEAKADIEARLAVVAKYRSKGLPRRMKTLTVIGSIAAQAELVVSQEGIKFRDSHGGPVTDLNVNGVSWDPSWQGKWVSGNFVHESDLFPINIEEIARWRRSGKIEVRKVYRGPGVSSFKVVNKEKGGRATFSIKIGYQSPEAKKSK